MNTGSRRKPFTLREWVEKQRLGKIRKRRRANMAWLKIEVAQDKLNQEVRKAIRDEMDALVGVKPEDIGTANLDLWKGAGFYIDPKEFMVNLPIMP